jgi:hypothetical protein
MANLLSEAGVKGFKLEPASQTEVGQNAEVTWSAPGVRGALVVVTDPSIKSPSDSTPFLISLAAKNCKGKFASGAMPEDGGGSRVFSSCQVGLELR